MWRFSEAYADQTERDFGRFIEAIHEGRIKAAELAPAAPAPAKVATAKTAKPKAKAKSKGKASGAVKR